MSTLTSVWFGRIEVWSSAFGSVLGMGVGEYLARNALDSWGLKFGFKVLGM